MCARALVLTADSSISVVSLLAVAAVSIVLLGLTIALTCALFNKLKYLHREDGQMYGNLQPSSDATAGELEN
jgi:hypothetical protein